MEEIGSEDFDPVNFINQSLGSCHNSEQTDACLNDLVSSLKILQKQQEVLGEASMGFINERLESIWDKFEEARSDVELLHQMISGPQDKKEFHNQDTIIDQKLMENMMFLNQLSERNDDVLLSLQSKSYIKALLTNRQETLEFDKLIEGLSKLEEMDIAQIHLRIRDFSSLFQQITRLNKIFPLYRKAEQFWTSIKEKSAAKVKSIFHKDMSNLQHLTVSQDRTILNQICKDLYPYFVVCFDSASILEVFQIIYFGPKTQGAFELLKNSPQNEPLKKFSFGVDFVEREMKILQKFQEDHEELENGYFHECSAQIVSKMILDLSQLLSLKNQNQSMDSLKVSRSKLEEFIAITTQKITSIFFSAGLKERLTNEDYQVVARVLREPIQDLVNLILLEDERVLNSVLPDFTKKKNCDLEEKFSLLNFENFVPALEQSIRSVKKVCFGGLAITWSQMAQRFLKQLAKILLELLREFNMFFFKSQPGIDPFLDIDYPRTLELMKNFAAQMEDFQEKDEVVLISSYLEGTKAPHENLKDFEVNQRLMVSFFQVLIVKFSSFLTFTQSLTEFLGQNSLEIDLAVDQPDFVDIRFIQIFQLGVEQEKMPDIIQRLREEPSKIMKIFDEYRLSIDRVLFRESQSVMEEFYRSCTNPKASKTSLKNSKSVLDLKQKLDQFLYKIEQVTSDISDQKLTNQAFLLLRNRDQHQVTDPDLKKLNGFDARSDILNNYWNSEYLACQLTYLSKVVAKIQAEAILTQNIVKEPTEKTSKLTLCQQDVEDLKSNILSLLKLSCRNLVLQFFKKQLI